MMTIQKKRAFAVISLALCALLMVPSRALAAEVTEPSGQMQEAKTLTADESSDIYLACQAVADGIDATQILVYDATADSLLYSKSVPGSKLYPASTTKLFSTYVALQVLSPDTVITAGDELDLLKSGSSIAYVGKGNRLTAEMLVEAMMLPSGNDAALVLAAGAGRTIAEDNSLSGADAVQIFVERMNDTAKELGFEKSHFANPDGYHVGAHYTCVNDMVRIAKLALENETISRYMKIHEDEDVVYASGHTNHWINTNHLLDPESEFYNPAAIGMKTGHTNQAGYCLMSAFRKNGHTIVIGVFGYQKTEPRFRDVVSLLDACT